MMQLLLVILSGGAAVVPNLILLIILWWLDRYDREPWLLLGGAFLWGAVGGVILGVAASVFLSVPVEALVNPVAADAVGTAIIAPLAEEPAKGLILLALVLHPRFDNVTDGFVYGAATGLGFGMCENFLYFAGASMEGNPASWAQLVFIRTLWTAPMHAVASALFGASLGLIKFNRNWLMKIFVPLGGMGLAMGVHALWNGSVVASQLSGSEAPALLSFIVFPLEALTLLILFQLAVAGDGRTIRTELVGEVPQGHATVIGSWLKRRRSGWLPPGVNRGRYIAIASELAFRKRQQRMVAPGRKGWYDAEVVRLRGEVQAILSGRNT